jgi:hypothetical protein
MVVSEVDDALREAEWQKRGDHPLEPASSHRFKSGVLNLSYVPAKD